MIEVVDSRYYIYYVEVEVEVSVVFIIVYYFVPFVFAWIRECGGLSDQTMKLFFMYST